MADIRELDALAQLEVMNSDPLMGATANLPVQRFNRAMQGIMGSPLGSPLPGVPQEAQILPQYQVRDVAQMGAEFSPGLGEALAVEDTIQNLKAGDYGMAALSGLGAIPILGAAVRPFRAAKQAGDVFYSKMLTHMENFPKSATPAEYKERLLNLAKKGVIKKSELDKSGLIGYLDLPGPAGEKVPRENLMKVYQSAVPEPQLHSIGGILDDNDEVIKTMYDENIPYLGVNDPDDIEAYLESPIQVKGEDYGSMHSFGEGNIAENIVGWARTQDYETPEGMGRAILEVQSDWAQDALKGATKADYPFDLKTWEQVPIRNELAKIAADSNITELTIPSPDTIFQQWGGQISPKFTQELYGSRIPRAIEKITGGKFNIPKKTPEQVAERKLYERYNENYKEFLKISGEKMKSWGTLSEVEKQNITKELDALEIKMTGEDAVKITGSGDVKQALEDISLFHTEFGDLDIGSAMDEFAKYPPEKAYTLKITPKMRERMKGPHPLFQVAGGTALGYGILGSEEAQAGDTEDAFIAQNYDTVIDSQLEQLKRYPEAQEAFVKEFQDGIDELMQTDPETAKFMQERLDRALNRRSERSNTQRQLEEALSQPSELPEANYVPFFGGFQ